jgi:hypothetical protein
MERLLRRSGAAGLRWLAFLVVGSGVAAACSDDPSASTDNPNGAGAGAGGRSDGGAGAAAAGDPASAGAGAGATPSGGAGGVPTEAGAGGVPQVPTLGEQCAACGATECTDKLASCSDSADCGAWLTCLTACATEACVAACDEQHAAAARVYAGVYDCLCTSCESDCSPVGACDKTTCVDADPLLPAATAPATLAETGLYATVDGSGGAGGAGGAAGLDLAMPFSVASHVRTFEPKYPLWSDGALKERYVYLPACSTIDTTDMDHWKFPVGTRFWKTFKVAGGSVGAAAAAVETRFLHRFGPGVLDWTYAAYQWDVTKPSDPTAAKLVSDLGSKDANGTSHDIPSVGQCKQCHNGLEEKVLGFGAIQLSHDATGQALDIKRISELGWLTTPAPEGFQVPGNPVQQAALGYLHGNCGGCHSEKTPTPGGSPQLLRLMVGQTTYATNDAVTTTVNAPIVSGLADIAGLDRIEPMEPTKSGLLIRMEKRAPAGLQMPPVGTEVPDTDGGVKAVTDWINSIPKPVQ